MTPSLSSAAKRKLKKQKEEFIKRIAKIKQHHEETVKNKDIYDPNNLSVEVNTVADNSVSEPTKIVQTSSCDTIISTKNEKPNIFNYLICKQFPTDKVHYKEPLSYQVKCFIIVQGPYQPRG